MLTILVALCQKKGRIDLIPHAIVLGLTLDFVLVFVILSSR